MVSVASLSPRRILAINFGGIGDEILFFPTLQSLRKAYPQSHLAVLVEPRCREIMGYAPIQLDEVLTFDIKGRPGWADLLDLLARLRHGVYDVAISTGQSSLVALLLFLSGASRRIGYAGSALDWLNTTAIPLKKQQYAAHMYHDLVNGIGLTDPAPLPHLNVPEESLQWANRWLVERGIEDRQGLVLLHPGTSALSQRLNMRKDWPVEHWVQLIELLHGAGYRGILAAGPDDHPVVEQITSRARGRFIATGRALDTLPKLAALIARCPLLVCVDSAPLHLAVAVGTSVVAIFGPTDEHKLVPPADPRFSAVTVDFDLPCGIRPCLWERRQTTCQDRQCLDKLPAGRVFEAIRQRLPLPGPSLIGGLRN